MDYLIIPIKSFKNSKNRLKPNLNDEARIEFCKRMALDVLNCVKNCKNFDKIIIITKEKHDLSELKNNKIYFLEDKEEKGINQAIQLAFETYNINEEDSLLILHADIPLLTEFDMNLITEKAKSSQKTAVIVPSRRKDGTNALFLKPPNLIEVQFGKNSYEKHVKSLEKIQDLKVITIENENISLDIDTYQDLIYFYEKESNTLSQKYLIEKKVVKEY